MPFGKEGYSIDLDSLSEDKSGHGGGDIVMLRNLIDCVASGDTPEFRLGDSVESHLMAFAAERSRLNGGNPELIKL